MEPVQPPWLVRNTVRAEADRALLAALARKYAVAPPLQPDCWLLADGAAFSAEAQPDGTPLLPCASVVMYQQREWNAKLPGILHRQIYVGRGLCVSVNSNDTVSVCSLLDAAAAQRGLRYSVWTSPAAGQDPRAWRGVLQRCAVTLGGLPWQPFGSNCHTVTQWQLTNARPTLRNGTAIGFAWKMGGVLGGLCLAVLWLLLWLAAAQHRRTRHKNV